MSRFHWLRSERLALRLAALPRRAELQVQCRESQARIFRPIIFSMV